MYREIGRENYTYNYTYTTGERSVKLEDCGMKS
jgi:hypothetical protein